MSILKNSSSWKDYELGCLQKQEIFDTGGIVYDQLIPKLLILQISKNSIIVFKKIKDIWF